MKAGSHAPSIGATPTTPRALSLSEFQRVSGLPDQAILLLLLKGLLPLELRASNELWVKLDQIDGTRLIQAVAQSADQFEAAWGEILEERCSYLIGQEFGRMIAALRSSPVDSPGDADPNEGSA